jgi:hypothetical protein
MGYLTTVTFYNDGVDQLNKHPLELADKLDKACSGVYTNWGKSESFGLGYHSNLVRVQRPRHADDKTVYVHLGNTLTEMNCNSKETIDIAKNNPTYFQDMLKEMK